MDPERKRGMRPSVGGILGEYRNCLLSDPETGPRIGSLHGGIADAATSPRGRELFDRTLKEFGIRSKTAGQSVKRP